MLDLVRLIDWPGCINFRDLGGVALRPPCETAPGIVYRSGSLVGIDATTAYRLRMELGITTFVDLRLPRELDRDGRPERLEHAGVRVIHCPIGTDGDAIRSIASPGPTDYAASYLATVQCSGAQIAAVLKLVAGADEPICFGCSLGKDRTGVVATMILLACTAPLRVIGREHALSARQLRATLGLLEADRQRKGVSELEYRRRIEATALAMKMFVTSWAAESGTVQTAFDAIGVPPETIDALRTRLVHVNRGAPFAAL